MKRFVVVLAFAAAVVVASLHYVRANPPPDSSGNFASVAISVGYAVVPATYIVKMPVSMKYGNLSILPGSEPAESPPQYVQPAVYTLKENAADMSGRTAARAPSVNPYTNRRPASRLGVRKTDGAYSARSGPIYL
jgi:hypothetical protein